MTSHPVSSRSTGSHWMILNAAKLCLFLATIYEQHLLFKTYLFTYLFCDLATNAPSTPRFAYVTTKHIHETSVMVCLCQERFCRKETKMYYNKLVFSSVLLRNLDTSIAIILPVTSFLVDDDVSCESTKRNSIESVTPHLFNYLNCAHTVRKMLS